MGGPGGGAWATVGGPGGGAWTMVRDGADMEVLFTEAVASGSSCLETLLFLSMP